MMKLILLCLSLLIGQANATTFCVIGDSISTRNNGASAVSWPELLASMADMRVQNYSIPGLTWRTARVPTPGWLIGGTQSPLEASRGQCDRYMVMMGVNDRANPNAMTDMLDLLESLPADTLLIGQKFWDDSGDTYPTVVTPAEAITMRSTYSAWRGPFQPINIRALYEMGMTYDGLHPTNSGKQWIASSIYMRLQQDYPLTPISRNIAWLYEQYKTNPVIYNQMMKISQ